MTNQLSNKIAILKFGSSVLVNESDIHNAIHEVYSYLRKNYKVIVVVSAIGNHTDVLDQQTKRLFCDDIVPDAKAHAALLATGEFASASLFLIGLIEVGIPATNLTYNCLKTIGPILDASPATLDNDTIFKLFKQHSVLVMPGFLGIHQGSNDISLLGRGGSDFTAIYFANELRADLCVLYKDTDGIYNDDPTINHQAKRYKIINYDDCLKLSYPVIQHKALHFAKQHNVNIVVKSINSLHQTKVNHEKSELFPPVRQKTYPTKVALIGLGTVGVGVYHYLREAASLFEIVGIGIKNKEKVRANFNRQECLTSDISSLIEQSDVIIDATGDVKFGFNMISDALKQKRHVITANKFLIGKHGDAMKALADQHHVALYYSATVGGGIPVLEVLNELKRETRKHKIESVYGVLNGTSNFIFEKVSFGTPFHQAVKLAQDAGFAESNASLDLNGMDAAEKLNIISQLVFNDYIKDLTIDQFDQNKLIKTEDCVLKQVAECKLVNNKLHASVKQVAVPLTHPLSEITGADNCVFIKTETGEVLSLRGRGAGRWPTALSVFADLLTIHFQHISLKHDHKITPFKTTKGICHETFNRANPF